MAPELYREYSRNEGIVLFGPARRAKELCGGQVVILPRAALCFATVGKSKRAAWRFADADHLVWTPPEGRAGKPIEYPRELERREPRWKSGLQLFIRRTAGTDRFTYLGRMFGVSRSYAGRPGRWVDSRYWLEHRVPRDLFLGSGGPTWTLSARMPGMLRKRVTVKSLTDVEQVLQKMAKKKFGTLALTFGPSGDMLSVGLKGRLAFANFIPTDPDDTPKEECRPYLIARSSGPPRQGRPVSFGDTELPRRWCITVPEMTKVVKHYYRTRELAKSVIWEEDR